jgi:hypothetical protein
MRHHAFALVAAIAFATMPVGVFAAIHTFDVASIDGAQETPPNGSTSTGSGTFTLDDSTGIATFNITHNCCTSGETQAHVHGPASPGVPAGIIYGLPAGNPKIGSSPVLTAQQQADMLANLHYVNIHSNSFVAGEIRGQIILTGTTQLKPTKTILVKNPPAGATKRKILWKVKENASSNTVTGDPTNLVTGGATLRVALTPGGDQCFDLPAGNWSPISSIGFKYKDADLSEGAVKVAQIKKTPSGNFLIKALLKGSGPQGITVVPGNPTTTYAVNLKIGNGDAYCSGTGAAVPDPNTATTFKAKNDTTPATCSIDACSVSGAFLDASDPLF